MYNVRIGWRCFSLEYLHCVCWLMLAVTQIAQTYSRSNRTHYVRRNLRFYRLRAKLNYFVPCTRRLRHWHQHRCPLFTDQFICLSILFTYHQITLCIFTIQVDVTHRWVYYVQRILIREWIAFVYMYLQSTFSFEWTHSVPNDIIFIRLAAQLCAVPCCIGSRFVCSILCSATILLSSHEWKMEQAFCSALE